MNTNIQNEVKSLLNKYRSGIISPKEFKTLTSDMNQLSDAELKIRFTKNGITLQTTNHYHKIK